MEGDKRVAELEAEVEILKAQLETERARNHPWGEFRDKTLENISDMMIRHVRTPR